LQRVLDILLRADHDEVDHVAKIPELVVNTTRQVIDYIAKLWIERGSGNVQRL
jgi:hypothetical protein